MATTKGPLFGQSASGTLADKLTFSSWKGRSYVKKKSLPTGTTNTVQSAVRQLFGFLTKAWTQTMTDADRAAWATLAKEKNLSAMNAFVADNMTDNQIDFHPHQRPGQTPTGAPPDFSTAPHFMPAVRAVQMIYTAGLAHQAWGSLLFAHRHTAGADVDTVLQLRSWVIGVIDQTEMYLGMLPGNYDIDILCFTTSGLVFPIASHNVDVLA